MSPKKTSVSNIFCLSWVLYNHYTQPLQYKLTIPASTVLKISSRISILLMFFKHRLSLSLENKHNNANCWSSVLHFRGGEYLVLWHNNTYSSSMTPISTAQVTTGLDSSWCNRMGSQKVNIFIFCPATFLVSEGIAIHWSKTSSKMLKAYQCYTLICFCQIQNKYISKILIPDQFHIIHTYRHKSRRLLVKLV